jgi:cytosine/uracil/thiamine/allantoin permease
MYGSKVMVAFRGAVAIIWYAVQTYVCSQIRASRLGENANLCWWPNHSYYCAEMMNVLLHAIFGSRWSNLPNHLPASSNTTTARMVCYFITWLAQVPVAFVQ